MLKQAFLQMSEVSVRMSRGGNPFIYLYNMLTYPRDVFIGQVAQHNPRSMSATNGDDEATACGNGRPCLCSNDPGSLPRH
jgi:hypothetical protein